MKKIITILAVGVALVANADYIYWMVDTPEASGVDIYGNPATFEWTDAVLSVDGNQIGTLSSSDAAIYNDLGAYAYATISPSYSDSSTFMIELYSSTVHDSSTWMARTSSSTDALRAYIFGDNSMSVMPASAFGLGATYAVPEPTSGLLFLVGGMLLGLKRRRQKV